MGYVGYLCVTRNSYIVVVIIIIVNVEREKMRFYFFIPCKWPSTGNDVRKCQKEKQASLSVLNDISKGTHLQAPTVKYRSNLHSLYTVSRAADTDHAKYKPRIFNQKIYINSLYAVSKTDQNSVRNA